MKYAGSRDSHRWARRLGEHHRRRISAWLLVVFLVAAGMVSAQGADIDDLEDKSLEELLQIKLVTPTAREQRAAESPAVVSVLTAQQLADLGVTTLYEALNYLPGVLVTETYFGYSAVNVRGLLQTHYNNKVLLMINGHPTREVINGSFHLELIPVDAIDRIEFVRGPGSALYGTNAFAGVVNVITKKGSDPSSSMISAGAGSFSTVEASLSYGSSSEAMDLMVSLSTHNDDGYPYRIEQDERGNAGVLDYSNDFSNALAVIEVGEITFSAGAFKQQKAKFGITPVADYTGPAQFTGGFTDIKWCRQLNKELSVTARLRWDTMDRDSEVGSFPVDGFEGHTNADTVLYSAGSLFGTEVSLAYSKSPKSSYLGGVVYEHRRTEPYLFVFADDGSLHPFTAYTSPATDDNLSVFGQGLFALTDRLDAVIGFRFSEDRDAGSSFVPRLGLVYRLAGETYIKALYAEAYRTPDFFEQRVETYNVLYGDESLEEERIKNVDLALDTTFGSAHNLRVNAFYLSTADQIGRVPTTDPDRTGESASVYANGGGVKIWGLEGSFIGQLCKPIRLYLNYSYRDGEDKVSGDDLEQIANHTGNLGLVWAITDRLDFKPNIQYVGRRAETESYLLANAVISIDIVGQLTVELIGRNLSDKHYAYPEYVRGVISEVPGGPERSYYARLRWRY